MGIESLPTPGFYVDDELVGLFKDTINQLISDMGRKITLFLPPIASGCPNCLEGFDGTSQGLYNTDNTYPSGGAFNKPFLDGGICPVCKGTHEIVSQNSIQYTALISRNPKDLNYSAIGKEFDPDNMFLTKTQLVSFEDIKITQKALIDGNMVVPARSPLKTGLRDLAFVRMLWQRIDK